MGRVGGRRHARSHLPTFLPISAPSGPTYDAIFYGTASGNQGSALASFIEGHVGGHIAISGPSAVWVQGNRTTAAVLLDNVPNGFGTTTIDFINSGKVQATGVSYGILNFQNAYNMVWNDPHIEGSGYTWLDPNGDGEDPDGVEDGLGIYGGHNLTFNNPYIHDNRGDGVYIGEASAMSSGIVMNNVNLTRNARNNVGHICGDVHVTGGTMSYAGLHCYDMEPNTGGQSATIDLVMSGVALSHYNDKPVVAGTGYALAGAWGGGAATTKVRVDVQNCSADLFTVVLDHYAATRFTGNSSTSLVDGSWGGGGQGPLEFAHCGTKNPAAGGATFNAANTNIQNPSPYS